MIVVTGASGFLGSCLIAKLNQEGFNAIVAVDNFNQPVSEKFLKDKRIIERIGYDDFINWIGKNYEEVEFVFHVDYTCNVSGVSPARLNFSQQIWASCISYQIPVIYADALGNNSFNSWLERQKEFPFFWASLKLPIMYGPNDSLERKDCSPIFHIFKQIQDKGYAEVPEGGETFHFLYVKDFIEVCYFMMRQRKTSDFYVLKTGRAHSLRELAGLIFYTLKLNTDIRFIKLPGQTRDRFLNVLESNSEKLRNLGYNHEFVNLENGLNDYLINYLLPDRIL